VAAAEAEAAAVVEWEDKKEEGLVLLLFLLFLLVLLVLGEIF
jgi:hypothetical protein